MARAGTTSIQPVTYVNPLRPELALEVLAVSELRRKAPADYLARPQRPTFHQVLVPARGRCVHEIDFQRVTLSPGVIAWSRPGQVIRFDLRRGFEGFLLLFTEDFLEAGFTEPLGPRFEVGDAKGDVAWLVERLRRISEEVGADLGSTRALLRHLLHALLVLLGRSASANAPAFSPVFELFRTEVERRFAKTRAVQEYARVIGYSAKTLTRATEAAMGLSAKAYVDRRVLLESQRLLAHTELGTSEIAARVGFSEATNFSKFFQREAHESPSAFRARSRH